VTTQTLQETAATRTLGPWRFVVFELLFGAAAGAAALLADQVLRPVLLWGVGSALLAGLLSLPAVHLGLGKGTNGLLAGFTVGFFARGLLVALGLVLSGARGTAALPFVAAFFVLYAATQGAEIVYVIQHARAAGGQR
jgi:hypothetical protein